MTSLKDSQWPSADSLLVDAPVAGRVNVALVGVSTYATSVSARSATSTPRAIREALARYSTWSFSEGVDLAERVALVDYGDVEDPDGDGGGERVRDVLARVAPSIALTLVLGGDNAATWHALRATTTDLTRRGLVTLDAHLDMREGRSNGSPVRQLLEEGLDGRHVVQVGLSDFANSAPYAHYAHDAGVTVVTRGEVRGDVEALARRALGIAGGGERPVYVDVDLDVADRAVVPGCPGAAPGGLSADELRRFVREVASANYVSTIDFTEIDVERDTPDGRTVRLAALLVLEALLGALRRES